MTTVKDHFMLMNHGSIWSVTPLTDYAKNWWFDNVDPEAPTMGKGFIVEPRYLEDILEGFSQELQGE